MTISALVKAIVTIEYGVGTWNGESNFIDLHEQVSREALNTIRQKMTNCDVRVIGDPQIKIITFERA